MPSALTPALRAALSRCLSGSGAATLTIASSTLEGDVSNVHIDPGCTLNSVGAIIDADPVFANPASGNFRLAPGSSCIDAGDSTAVPAGVTTDLDGNPRFINAVNYADSGVSDGMGRVVDIGAFEADVDIAQAPCPGDADGSGAVDLMDINMVPFNFGETAPIGTHGNVNRSGTIDLDDLNIVLFNFGAMCG
jgi:hypothetical protein